MPVSAHADCDPVYQLRIRDLEKESSDWSIGMGAMLFGSTGLAGAGIGGIVSGATTQGALTGFGIAGALPFGVLVGYQAKLLAELSPLKSSRQIIAQAHADKGLLLEDFIQSEESFRRYRTQAVQWIVEGDRDDLFCTSDHLASPDEIRNWVKTKMNQQVSLPGSPET